MYSLTSSIEERKAQWRPLAKYGAAKSAGEVAWFLSAVGGGYLHPRSHGGGRAANGGTMSRPTSVDSYCLYQLTWRTTNEARKDGGCVTCAQNTRNNNSLKMAFLIFTEKV